MPMISVDIIKTIDERERCEDVIQVVLPSDEKIANSSDRWGVYY